MSKKNKKTYATEEVLGSLDKVAHDSESFLQRNSKAFISILAVVIVAVLGYFGYQTFIVEPKNIDATDALIEANRLYVEGKETNDTIKLKEALGGKSSGTSGFLDIASEYGKTKTGKLALLYAGNIEFDNGNYNKALEYFSDFDSKDKDLLAVKYAAIADTYVELNNDTEAMNFIEKAARESSSAASVFQFNKKAGILAMSLNQNEKALVFFKTIKDKFPDIDETGEIDAYIERLTYLTSK